MADDFDPDKLHTCNEQINCKQQQQRYFVRWSYKERSNYNRGARVEAYNIIDCNKFDDWLEKTRDEYLCFDLLIVNKM